MSGDVLVAFGTRHESTRGIAALVANVLRAGGVSVDLRPVDEVGELGRARAAVLGSVVYDGEWLPGAYEFLALHERELRAIPTWLFASGPLEHLRPGMQAEVPSDLVEVIGRIGPRDVAIFTGPVQPHHLASGLRLLTRVARTNVGDHRDWAAIERWAGTIRDAILAGQPVAAETPRRSGSGF